MTSSARSEVLVQDPVDQGEDRPHPLPPPRHDEDSDEEEVGNEMDERSSEGFQAACALVT
jgi:hypothetical protein